METERNERRMTKQEQFLWITQTMLLANATNMASRAEWADEYRHVISACGAFSLADEALRASELIPKEMATSEAAHQFCGFMLDNLRQEEEQATGKRLVCPYWFARS